MEEGTLHKWFKGSRSKDGKPGWVNVRTGGTCASDEPGEGTPKCVSSAKRASMTKAERDSAARRKKAADPGQQQKTGAAKPTYVSTDLKKKMRKEEVRSIDERADFWHPDPEKDRKLGGPGANQRAREDRGSSGSSKPVSKKDNSKSLKPGESYMQYAKRQRAERMRKEELEVTEAKDKPGKGSGKKDDCYHKVKSRYRVWPSAYASGALVKCRKVGAANWGNKSEEVEIGEKKEGITFIQFREAVDKSKMKCNKPKAQAVGDSLTGKSHVVKACEGGKEKIIRFGQRGVKGSPKKEGESDEYAARRKAFKDRHAKNIAKGKMSAAYWANKVKW